MHLHPHLHHPHVDLHALGHDALIAAEIALAAVVVTGSVDRFARTQDLRAPSITSAPVTTPVAGTVESGTVVATIDVFEHADAVRAVIRVPAGSTARIALVDEHGTHVAESTLTEAGWRIDALAPGRYAFVLTHEGPVEHIGDAAISSAMAMRSAPFAVTDGMTVQAVIEG